MASSHPLVERFRSGDIPAPLKAAAARGALPLPAEDLLEALFHLRRDPSKELQQDIIKTIDGMPLGIVQQVAAAADTPPAMLDFLARASIRRDQVLEKVVGNTATADATLALIAQHGSESILEFLSFNQVRLTRSPQILQLMLQSPRVTQSIRRRLQEIWELHERETARGARVTTAAPAAAQPALAEEDEPALLPEEPAASAAAPAADEQPEPVDAAEVVEAPQVDPAEIPETLEDLADLEINAKILEEMARDEGVTEDDLRLAQRLLTMTVPEKVQLALKGDREARMVLIRDSSKQVQESVVGSPKLTDNEIEQIAKMRSISADVIRALTGKREAMKIYSVVKSLVMNPKCPVHDAITLMQRLQDRDLNFISKDKNIPDQVRRHALIVLDKRKPKGVKKKGGH